MTLRDRYLKGDIDHHEYYGALVERLGEEQLRRLLPAHLTRASWRRALAADPHLNNVSLGLWDQRDPCVLVLVRAAGGTTALEPIIGTGGWSLADSVCVMKETARRFAQEENDR